MWKDKKSKHRIWMVVLANLPLTVFVVSCFEPIKFDDETESDDSETALTTDEDSERDMDGGRDTETPSSDSIDTGDTGDTNGTSDTSDTADTGNTSDTGDTVDTSDTADTGDSETTTDTNPVDAGSGDLCPDDPDKTEPGLCGCGVADQDVDSDTQADCLDLCIDRDQDTYGSPGGAGNSCAGADCNDSDSNIKPGAAELCDNKDNNCDGETDEGLTRACYSGPSGTNGVGPCHGGEQTCSAGDWGAVCPGEVVPVAADTVCDGQDADCDGVSDVEEGCGCIDGDTEGCYTGPIGTENVGTCHGGTRTCDTTGEFGACTGQVIPLSEDLCTDRLDNDCDDQINEECCSHDICVEGSALDTDCDPCVADICIFDEECLSSWDEFCVSWVYMVCDSLQCYPCLDPLEPTNGCDSGNRCEPGLWEGDPSDCLDNVGSALGYQGCGDDADCGSKYSCIEISDTDTDKVCNQWCRVGHGNDCPSYPDEDCWELVDGRYIGDENWGVCWTEGVPPTWDSLCEGFFGDGDCDCGCGAYDYEDCTDITAISCDVDWCVLWDKTAKSNNNAACE